MLLENIKKDHISGADEVLQKTATYFLENCRTSIFASASEAKDFIRRAGLELIQAQPRMAPLFNLVNSLFLNCDKHTEPALLIETIRSTINEFLDRNRSAREEILSIISPLIRENMTITTYSRSSLVIFVLKHLAGEKKFNVCLMESRPMFEGRKAALELAEAGVSVTLTVDAAMRRFMRSDSGWRGFVLGRICRQQDRHRRFGAAGSGSGKTGLRGLYDAKIPAAGRHAAGGTAARRRRGLGG